MELLIIFIIMMVISSILRSFRGAAPGGRAYTPPAPQPPRPEIPPYPLFFDIPQENLEEAPPLESGFPEWPEYGRKTAAPLRESFKAEKDTPTFDLEEPKRQASLPSKTQRPVPSKPAPARIRAFEEEEQNLGTHLQELLSGDKLPLGIVAAEVFSAPRARRPLRIKMGRREG
jgi:hypothetical protein